MKSSKIFDREAGGMREGFQIVIIGNYLQNKIILGIIFQTVLAALPIRTAYQGKSFAL
jgi:hypothetical protein